MADRIIVSTSESPEASAGAPADALAERRNGGRGRRWAIARGDRRRIRAVGGRRQPSSLNGRTTAVSLASQTQVVPFEMAAGTPGALAMAYTPGEAGVLLWGSGLKDPGADKVYEVWMIANGTPVSGGCLRPTDGSVVHYSNANLGDATEMAVTVESASCPGAPTTEPIMTAALTA